MKSDSEGLITIRVINHLPIGLGVETEDGQYGIVRVREISWDKDRLTNWKVNYPINWVGKACVLSSKRDQIKEFSFRLVESDPWENVQKILKKGNIYEGVVTGILNYGIFVEIASGVTGLLHKSQLPAWVKPSPIELFWPGDQVYVNVQEVNIRERKIRLGFPESTRHYEPEAIVQPISRQILSEHGVHLLLKEKVKKKHFLVVEDTPEQSSTITNWLRHLGQQVDVVVSAEDALIFLEKTTPDIALIDVGLPKMSGTKLSLTILETWPQVRVVVTTDWARAENVMGELEELQHRQAELLIKPFLPEDLIDILKKEKITNADDLTNRVHSDQAKLTTQLSADLRSISFHKNLLDHLRIYLDYDLVILFAFDRNHRQVSIHEYSGDESRLNTGAIPQLIYSPVRDVAEDQSMLIVNDIQEHDRDRCRYLLELYPDLKACIGAPVRTHGIVDFALFALDSRSHQASQEQMMLVEAAAMAIGTALSQKSFIEKSILIQRSALIGHLTRGMVHEINNLVGPLHSRLDEIRKRLKKIEKQKVNENLPQLDQDQLLKELDEIQNNTRKIINTTHMFGRFAAKSKTEVLRVDEIVEETIHFMRDISHQSHVKIHFTPPEQLLVIRNQAAALEQVLLNVLLNAVQQIAELRLTTGGWVHVEIEPPFEKNGQSFFQIKIEDDGPGIHAVLWDKVFEAGYTTRQDGSGIGLYISQNLIEEVGGQIYIEKSHVLSGTTFVLEIPYHL